MDGEGAVLPRHKKEVRNILPDIVPDVVHNVIPDETLTHKLMVQVDRVVRELKHKLRLLISKPKNLKSYSLPVPQRKNCINF